MRVQTRGERTNIESREGNARVGPYGYAVMLVPAIAGLGVGALVNTAIDVPEVAGVFWAKAHIDAALAPAPGTISAACVLAALALWSALAALVKGGGNFVDALRREAFAFLPFLLIPVLCLLYRWDVLPIAILFSNHAAVLAVAGLAGVNAYLFTAARTAVREAAPPGRRGTAGVIVAAAVYWAVFSTMGTLQYYSLNISYTDTADWEQMLWNTLHGRFLMSSAFPHMFLGEHVQFSQLLFLPFYALFPSLVTLMVLKSAVLASGAFPVYLLAKRRLASPAAAACFAIAYLLYPAMQYTDLEIVQNTFRPEVVAIPALLWAVYFLDAERMLGLVVASFFAMSAKEEMALPVAMIGVLLLVRRRWAWGGGFFVVGAAWFLASVLWVIPHFRGGPTHMLNFYGIFGKGATFTSAVEQLVFHPLHTLALAFGGDYGPRKVNYLLMLVVPLGMRPVFSWRMILVMLPGLAAALLASPEQSYSIYWHYQASLVPFLVMGAVYGAGVCAAFLSRFEPILGTREDSMKRGLTAGLATLVLVASIGGNVLYAKSPLSLNFYNPAMITDYWRSMYVPGERARLFFDRVRPLVPEDASVSATEFVATYFAARRDDFVFPLGAGQADYVVVDTRDPWLAGALQERGMPLEKALEQPGFERVFDQGGFIVYRKAQGPVAGGSP